MKTEKAKHAAKNKNDTFLCFPRSCFFNKLPSNCSGSPIIMSTQDVAKGAGKEVILGDQRIEELFEQIGVAWKEVCLTCQGAMWLCYANSGTCGSFYVNLLTFYPLVVAP